MEYIYVLQCNEFYKIGRTGNSDIDKRVKDLQTGNPYKIGIKFSIEVKDSVKMEKDLHIRFASTRGLGEWFKLTDLQLAELDLLQEWIEPNIKESRKIVTNITKLQEFLKLKNELKVSSFALDVAAQFVSSGHVSEKQISCLLKYHKEPEVIVEDKTSDLYLFLEEKSKS